MTVLPEAVALSVLRMMLKVFEEKPALLAEFRFLEDLPKPGGGASVPWDVVDPAKRREMALDNLRQLLRTRQKANKRLGSPPAGDPAP